MATFRQDKPRIGQYLQLSPAKRRQLYQSIDLVELTDNLIDSTDTDQVQVANLRPSMIGSGSGRLDGHDIGCARALWYSYFGTVGTPQTRQSKLRTAIGTAYHQMLDSFYEDAGIKLEDIDYVELEKELVEDREVYTMGGSCDALIHFVDGTKMVIDFKTIGLASFNKLTKPHDYHLSQVHVYMYLSDVPLGGILYVSSEGMGSYMSKGFTFGWSQTRWKAIEKRLDQVEKAICNMELPPAEGSFKYCNEWCPYRDICAKEVNQCLATSDSKSPMRSRRLKNWWNT